MPPKRCCPTSTPSPASPSPTPTASSAGPATTRATRPARSGHLTRRGPPPSAEVATHAAQLVADGERAVYALCRPPGHHAYVDRANGFCYLNNVAIAAQHLRQWHARVAILDIDMHHGNGTQGIFYRRADVLTISLHGDPRLFTPFFTGHAHEKGEGDGLGYNLNLPLARGTGDEAYLERCAAPATRCAPLRRARWWWRSGSTPTNATPTTPGGDHAGLRPHHGGDRSARPAHGAGAGRRLPVRRSRPQPPELRGFEGAA